MYLTKEEERILDGEQGEVKSKAIRVLISLGEIFKAEKLIPIESTQISGISYKTIGDAGLEFLEDWAPTQVVVESRMNPAGMDLRNWKEMGISKEWAEKQLRIIKALTSMGVKESCTCTPYLAGLIPKKGSHIAWSESSAVIYTNSILGARTNREGGPSALSAAIIGKTPNYGFHLTKNRIGEIVFNIEFDLGNLDYSLLGYYIGKIAQNKIPVINGINLASNDQLKSLGAGAAASGGVGMFMIKNITSEYRVIEKPEIINIEYEELIEIKNKLTNCNDPDVITFGCPHCSYQEIKKILKDLNTTKEIWIFTSREIRNKFGQIPPNVKILCDTCMVVAPIKELGIKCIATDSTKCAHYSQKLSNVKTLIQSREILIKGYL